MKMERICSGCRDGAEFEIPFAMAFQPIVDVETGRAFAYEALVRGVDGASAYEILSSVNETNRYAFDQACRVKAIETAMEAGLMQYSPLACIQLTLTTARRASLPIDRLIFEFTENEQMGSPEHVSSIIDTYKQIGFTVAVDDFGAGHSGLDMFARFHPDEIKLDMELIRGIDQDHRRRAIVRAIVRMCKELETLVIAEGIENAQEASALRELGVRYHQGYWYARPQLGVLPGIHPQAFL